MKKLVYTLNKVLFLFQFLKKTLQLYLLYKFLCFLFLKFIEINAILSDLNKYRRNYAYSG